jgi:hypothetical protein
MPFYPGLAAEQTDPVPFVMTMTVAKLSSLVTILCVDGPKFLHEWHLPRQKVL